jgi:hypothetical protein
MITIYYKTSHGHRVNQRRIAYIKRIDGEGGDTIRFVFDGIDSGTLSIASKHALIESSEVTIKLTEASEGINHPCIKDANGNVYRTEAFVIERGLAKRAPMPDGFCSEVTEALDTLDREFARLEEMLRSLAESISGIPLFEFK